VYWQSGKLQVEDEDQHIYSWRYADPIARQLICTWKYHFDHSSWEIMKKKLRPSLVGLRHLVHIHNIEAVVPVPLHSVRCCKRGFDQAVMIAEFIGQELELPVVDLIKRTRSTGKQAEREAQDRIESMKNNPFSILAPPPFEGGDGGGPLGSILLIDDVWTTGATIIAAADVIQKSGVEKVWKYTLAKG